MEQRLIHRVPDGHSPMDQKCNKGKIHPSTYPKPLEIVEGGTLRHAGAGNSTGSNRNDPHKHEHENPRATGKDFCKSNAAG
eukprot:scaffold28993_cov65-Attheya_sp.AAC.1